MFSIKEIVNKLFYKQIMWFFKNIISKYYVSKRYEGENFVYQEFRFSVECVQIVFLCNCIFRYIFSYDIIMFDFEYQIYVLFD